MSSRFATSTSELWLLYRSVLEGAAAELQMMRGADIRLVRFASLVAICVLGVLVLG
jgi:hypothetical protein